MRSSGALLPLLGVVVALQLCVLIGKGTNAEPQRSSHLEGNYPTEPRPGGGGDGGVRFLNSRVSSAGRGASDQSYVYHRRRTTTPRPTTTTTTQRPVTFDGPTQRYVVKLPLSSSYVSATGRDGQGKKHRHRHGYPPRQTIEQTQKLQALTQGKYSTIEQGSYFDSRPNPPPEDPTDLKSDLFDWNASRSVVSTGNTREQYNPYDHGLPRTGDVHHNKERQRERQRQQRQREREEISNSIDPQRPQGNQGRRRTTTTPEPEYWSSRSDYYYPRGSSAQQQTSTTTTPRPPRLSSYRESIQTERKEGGWMWNPYAPRTTATTTTTTTTPAPPPPPPPPQPRSPQQQPRYQQLTRPTPAPSAWPRTTPSSRSADYTQQQLTSSSINFIRARTPSPAIGYRKNDDSVSYASGSYFAHRGRSSRTGLAPSITNPPVTPRTPFTYTYHTGYPGGTTVSDLSSSRRRTSAAPPPPYYQQTYTYPPTTTTTTTTTTPLPPPIEDNFDEDFETEDENYDYGGGAGSRDRGNSGRSTHFNPSYNVGNELSRRRQDYEDEDDRGEDGVHPFMRG